MNRMAGDRALETLFRDKSRLYAGTMRLVYLIRSTNRKQRMDLDNLRIKPGPVSDKAPKMRVRASIRQMGKVTRLGAKRLPQKTRAIATRHTVCT